MPKSFVGRVARRYSAGEEVEEAVRAVQGLHEKGCLATVGMLGEFATDERRCRERLEEYKQALDALEERGLDYRVAVKLTDLGLTLDKDLCRKNLEEILLYAKERGRFLEVDMEESALVSATLDMVLDAHERHGNTGAVVQAYLRRTLGDVQRLVEAGVPSVRLVKGTYVESKAAAYTDFGIIRDNYVLVLEELMRGGAYVGIATHDEHLVWHALRLVHQLSLAEDRYEFQMLMGVQEELRSILVGAGHRVRVTVLFGKDWYEYSLRRLKENPQIAGHVTRDVLGSVARFAGQKTATKG